MKIIIRQFCGLLASSNFDQKQIHDIISEVSRTKPAQLIQEIEATRKWFSGAGSEQQLKSTQQPDSVIEGKIVDLLVVEAGFSKTEAYAQFHSGLITSFPGRKVAGINTKAGFATWIRNLRKQFSDSELLHVATRIRNRRIHGVASKDDWLHREG